MSKWAGIGICAKCGELEMRWYTNDGPMCEKCLTRHDAKEKE